MTIIPCKDEVRVDCELSERNHKGKPSKLKLKLSQHHKSNHGFVRIAFLGKQS